MKRLLPGILPLLLVCSALSAYAQQPLTLVENGTTRYRIVLPVVPSPAELRAASVLQDHVRQMTDVTIPITSARGPASDWEILLGRNERLGITGIEVDFDTLQEDGFTLRSAGNRLVVAGGTDGGTLHGVYKLLEVLGCRLYSSQMKVVPRTSSLTVAPLDRTDVPAFHFRDTYYRDTNDPEYAEWHAIDHDEQGQHPDWGLWVHTFDRLVPPERLFATHPEYYALVDGKRVPTQLCLTHPDVLDTLVANLRREIAANPGARYWSVSQNDNTRHCTCDRCRAIDEREGSPSGSLLHFVNQVAAQFPDRVISTLAYQYTRRAPSTIRPASNVNIMLCSIEANRSKPIDTDPTSADFREDVEAWGRLTSNILVWDYVIQFENLVSPFPNLRTLGPNVRFFARNGVNAIFEQGNREIGGEFAELRAYLLAQLLWNPEVNVDSIMVDFVNGYYGGAAPYILQYIDEMHDALEASGQRLDIFGNPNQHPEGYLSPKMVDRYGVLFDQAEAAVQADPVLLLRVRTARLPVEYALLEQARRNWYGMRGLYLQDGERISVRPEITARLDGFIDLAQTLGVTRLKEWHTTPEEYRAGYRDLLARGASTHRAVGAGVTYLTSFSPQYPAAGAGALTDGIRGSNDYTYHWQGFLGQDAAVVIDLGKEQRISRITSGYLQNQLAWIFRPDRVTYEVSRDGRRFHAVGEIETTVPADAAGVQVVPMETSFKAQTARYIRVTTRSVISCPPWHLGAGGPAWLFMDEVAVE